MHRNWKQIAWSIVGLVIGIVVLAMRGGEALMVIMGVLLLMSGTLGVLIALAWPKRS